MATANEILIQALLEQSQEDLTENPTYALGKRLSVGAIPAQTRMSPWETILSGALSGFGGGVLQGMAESQALENQERRAQTMKEVASKTGEEKYSLVESDPEMKKYGPLMRLADASAKADALAEALSKPPTMRTITRGSTEVQQEFDPVTRTWKEAGSGPRWQPQTPQTPEDKTFDREMGLRKEFEGLPVTKAYEISDLGLKSLRGAIADKAATSDLELVRGAIQAIEPGMAVREGEATAAQNSGSIPEQWKAQINKTLTGESGLSENVRQGLLRIAERRHAAYADQFARQYDFYKSRAEADKLDPGSFSHIARPELKPLAEALATSTAEAAAVPPGMKLQRNKITGETRLVPK